MDTFLIVFAGFLVIAGVVGCIFPKLPGTPLCYLGIIILHYSSAAQFSFSDTKKAFSSVFKKIKVFQHRP